MPCRVIILFLCGACVGLALWTKLPSERFMRLLVVRIGNFLVSNSVVVSAPFGRRAAETTDFAEVVFESRSFHRPHDESGNNSAGSSGGQTAHRIRKSGTILCRKNS